MTMTTTHKFPLQPTAPDRPAGLRVLNVTSDSATLAWEGGFNGGRPQTYRVQYARRAPGSLYTQPSYNNVYNSNASTTTITVTGLAASSLYAFSLKALNALGESNYTAEVEARTLGGGGGGGAESNQPLVDGLTDTANAGTGQSVPLIITVTVGVCGTLLLLLSVVLISCLVHKRRREKSSSTTTRDGNL